MTEPNSLDQKVIIYDDTCPLCNAYTGAFVRTGLLSAEGRQCFSTASPEVMAALDLDRSRHEIPLYDRVTGKTLYGMDSLFFILGNRWAWLKPLFGNGVFRAIIYQFYQLITYNRRIIAGSMPSTEGFDCAPDFNMRYRSLYIVLALLISGLLASAFGASLLMTTVFCAVAALLGVFFVSQKMDFLGHWATVGLLAQGILLPLHLLPLPNNVWVGLYILAFGFFFARRMRLLWAIAQK